MKPEALVGPFPQARGTEAGMGAGVEWEYAKILDYAYFALCGLDMIVAGWFSQRRQKKGEVGASLFVSE